MKVVSFTTGISHGDARAPGALERLLKSKRLPAAAASGEQVHGPRIHILSKLSTSKKVRGVDGLLTDALDQPLAIFTADCVPLFLSADRGRAVGLLHAGWRGVRGAILAQAVKGLRRKWRIKPSQIAVWAGPHIRACCFETKWDVARFFPRARLRQDFGGQARWKVDLEGELKRQAKKLGIRWTQPAPRSFSGGGDCTMHGSRHFSYRRDKTAKRQVSVIIKRKES